jgi:AraC-like DNA-binding protein
MISGPLRLSGPARASVACIPFKRRFLVAARDLLVERGAAVTLSEIARRAGVDEPVAPPGPLEAFLAHRLDELLELVPPPDEHEGDEADLPGWLAELRAALPARLADRTSSLRAVSTDLAVSPRTLQRRLAEAGTSWRAEVETARRRLAIELALAGEGRKGVARRIGYSDTRALRRALRRWNGAAAM